MTYGFLTGTPRLFHLPVSSGRLAITLDDLVWLEFGREIKLTRGFPTDGLSLPGLARALGFDPWGKGLRAALLHDAGYSLHDRDEYSLGDRSTVDRRFRRGCEIDFPRMANTYYRAVRMFGWGPWARCNAMHMEGYLYALAEGAIDGWINHILAQHGGEIINLREAD